MTSPNLSLLQGKMADERPRRRLMTAPGCGRTMKEFDMSDGIEQWRPVVGNEGLHEVSNLGRVRSVTHVIVQATHGRRRTVHGRLLKIRVGRSGYQEIALQADPAPTRGASIHRLVCEAFNGPAPETGSIVRHLNGQKFDNRPENLAWGTHAENSQDSIKHGTNARARKTICKRGHPLSGENLYIRPSTGYRKCKECSRVYKTEWDAAARERRQGLAA